MRAIVDPLSTGNTGSAGGRAEALFHAITEAATHANVGVIVTVTRTPDRSIDIAYMNQALVDMIGEPREEIERKGVWAYVAMDELEHLQGMHSSRGEEREGQPALFRTAMTNAQGKRVPLEVSLGIVELDGQPASVAFIVDITPRANAEEALRRSQALLERVVTNAPDGIYILRWPRVLFANPAGARILDVAKPEDAIGTDLTTRMAPDDAAMAAQRIDTKMTGTRLEGPRQYIGKNPNGPSYALEITSHPIEFEGAPAILSFARDVTERNEMLKKLGEAEAHAAMNTLAAGVAHEINNPLAYLLLNLEFLARELRELRSAEPERMEAMQKRLDDARQGAERVKAIVRDLQALTRKDQNIRGPVELDQVIDNALALARHETRQRARVETQIAGPLCVLGNSTRLEQLFFNLIANAAHAMGERPAEQNLIRVTLAHDGPDHVLVEVGDNGSGMDDATLRRAFEPFFTTKPLGVGSGLGLPICKRIVEDLGGQISMRSSSAGGTTVSVRLPIEPVQPETARSAKPNAEVVASQRGRILVVDDERAVADSLRFALKEDHAVDVATSSKDARSALDSGVLYDVVLCDLVMPVESGMELHAYARERHPELAQRFVFMTGGAFTARAERFLKETENPHIEKPFELDSLRTLIDAMVAKRKAPQP